MDQLIETTFSAGLDASGVSSLQEQLHSQIRSAILSGQLPAGTRLPATRLLSSHLSIARNTVLGAYDQLIAEGYLETRQGAGTFVSNDIPDTFIETPNPTQKETKEQSFTSIRFELGLLSGAPALDQFPKDIWARITSRVWRHADRQLLRHDDLAGYAPLRRAIAKYLQASRGVRAGANQILIFSGLQQGMKMAAECLLNDSDKVFLENPGYSGLRQVASTLRQQTHYVPVDCDGATVPPKHESGLTVICPSRQFPLGMTMPLSRRMEHLEWARETDSLILEDDYDSEFRYAGRPLSSLQGIDGGQHVIYGGTFSKSMFPALRLGYLVLPEHLVDRVIAHRAACDSYPSIVAQISLAAFMEEGHFARHIRKLRKTHARRQAVFSAAFEKYVSEYLDLEPADTGLHMIARPRAKLAHLTDTEIIKVARSCSIGVFSLSASFAANEPNTLPQQGMLMGFASLDDHLIEPTLEKFGTALAKQFP